MEWVKGFLIPIIEVVFIGGIVGWILFIIGRAFHNAWSKAGKYAWKYKILKKPYPERAIKWVLECLEKGIGWYDAKKLLMVKMLPTPTINETLWIYDQVIISLNKQKGGKNNGRKHQGSDSKDEIKPTEFPNFAE